MAQLMVGVARRNITPPIGAIMAGYAARDHGAEGVHDELFVRALFVCDGETCAVLLARDLCDVENREFDLLADMFAERMNLGRDRLFIANTHTHSGPRTSYDEEAENRAYIENLAAVCVGAAEEARSNARPATVAHARRPVQCGVNRRERREDGTIVLGVNPEGPVDRAVDVLVLRDASSDEPLATLLRHGVHGVVMGADNYLISGDAPGAAEAFVEANLPGAALFLAGCSGNINAEPRASFENVALLGRRLGGATVQATTETDRPRSDVPLVSVRHEFELPIEALPSAEEAHAALEEAEAQLAILEAGNTPSGLSRWEVDRRLRHAQAQLDAITSGEDVTGLPTFVQILALGELALFGWPAEVFFEIGRQVIERSPFPVTLDVTHVNGSIGYVPIASAYAEGGYEVTARAHHCGLGITAEAERVLVTETLQGLARAREMIG